MSAHAETYEYRDTPILETIAFGESIPALPAGVPELLKDLTNDEIGFRELTDKLIKFPSITSRLLVSGQFFLVFTSGSHRQPGSSLRQTWLVCHKNCQPGSINCRTFQSNQMPGIRQSPLLAECSYDCRRSSNAVRSL